ncbi:MAG: class I tRNA ligase family protein, partial [Patescibacteria group bacterium]
MSTRYQPQEFEKKWAEEWNKNKIYKAPEPDSKRKKQFIFPMFPYPSGAGLHVGHVRVYTGTDIVARYFRMNQYAVLHPIGWDAFGLPAENAAIKAKKNPMDMVPDHIATFKRQMISLGFSFDWDRELATTDPNYYKWTQWLFIQFYKMGLLYKKNTPINYCSTCKTGLAEEEVLADGTHERCGNKIEKRDLPQWVFKITKYADRLLSDLEGLDWPKGILEMQRNWIGRKEGVIIRHNVKDLNIEIETFSAYPA